MSEQSGNQELKEAWDAAKDFDVEPQRPTVLPPGPPVPIPGVPDGYRLGKRLNWNARADGTEDVTFELIPIEKPAEQEAVIVVPIALSGWTMLDSAIKKNEPWHIAVAEAAALEHPDQVTIREKRSSS